MCGILAVVSPEVGSYTDCLVKASQVIRHRGPDDEGFLTWSPGSVPQVWSGEDSSDETKKYWNYPGLPQGVRFNVGFAHRRLSIIDLSPLGHQPMVFAQASLAITYNGEIYNYLEIRKELVGLGHQFLSTSDTEVILHAWQQWGPKSLDRLNGMFAFVILDFAKNEVFAARDRFGVKPLYIFQGINFTIFASEIKQIRAFPGYRFSLDTNVTLRFLADGTTDGTEDTFDKDIKKIPPGCYARISRSANPTEFVRWYYMEVNKNKIDFTEASKEFRELLTDAVRLRLRSDVKVGSCLSGGLDSSSIVCIMADLLHKEGVSEGLETVTACFDQLKYDEWFFAEQVVKQTSAIPHKTFPSFSQLIEDLNDFLWTHDEPVGSTSIFSQWAVFKATHNAGLKVMIDGQGADEYLAGYGSNDLPLFAGLLASGNLSALLDEVLAYKKEKKCWPVGFLLGALQLNFGPRFSRLLPARLRLKQNPLPAWLVANQEALPALPSAGNLKAHFRNQLFYQPLPALLRYEDRNSMAWSVESRTPFMDYRLVEFAMGLPDRYIYKNSIRKVILRKAMHGILPEAVANRRDKMGFVTPEELWLKGEGEVWFRKGLEQTTALFPGYFNRAVLFRFFDDMVAGNIPFDFSIWRIVCFGRWYQMVTAHDQS